MNSQPDIWVIGDVQGCCLPLAELLAHNDIAGNPSAQLWFAGDLVNRGPHSLETLRQVIGLGDKAVSVLGNHDLHLLAVAAGIKKPGKSDTIQDILNTPDASNLIDWLRHCPMAHFAHQHLLVHAGLLGNWDVNKTLSLAAEVETALRARNWKDNLKKMYGNEPAYWSDELSGNKRLRVIINALTRIRMCTAEGHMEFKHKNAPVTTAELMPWYDVPNRATQDITVVFGHWSTLGLLIRPDVICLDTGCIWGGQLTALRLGDHKLIQVECEQYQKPSEH
ncbi:MAG TPA: symmetrical bis(5'-nucleosyl)-tetraphosphatase [Eoetvoesiella sp.]